MPHEPEATPNEFAYAVHRRFKSEQIIVTVLRPYDNLNCSGYQQITGQTMHLLQLIVMALRQAKGQSPRD